MLLMGKLFFQYQPLKYISSSVLQFSVNFLDTKVYTSNNKDMDNHLVVCVCLSHGNFVLDLSTYAYHQKYSKLVCFVFQLNIDVSLNEMKNLWTLNIQN